ncbi:hypothetical protein V6Z11_D05G206300 [Gossypium hirsutum]
MLISHSRSFDSNSNYSLIRLQKELHITKQRLPHQSTILRLVKQTKVKSRNNSKPNKHPQTLLQTILAPNAFAPHTSSITKAATNRSHQAPKSANQFPNLKTESGRCIQI